MAAAVDVDVDDLEDDGMRPDEEEEDEFVDITVTPQTAQPPAVGA